MDIDGFEQKLVAKIRDEKITPYPRWHFLLKNYVVWVVGIVALFIGAAAVSVMIYFFKYSGWEIREEAHKSLVDFLLLTLPYFWIIFLGIFVFILYYNLHHTKRGYRYPIWLIVVASVVLSAILGGILFLAGWGQKIDDLLGEQVPFYDTVINRQLGFLFNPDEGRLVGLVSGQNNDQSFNIIDPLGNQWQVFSKSGKRSLDVLELHQPIGLVGKMISENIFEARVIRPIHPGRRFLSRPHDHN
ncbi:MAG: hypothetical protein WC249_01240 [Patescibacteria group bacterium]|jgi:heme/copper-type cytochrome/quinol oxidase subunit 2